MTPLDHMVVLRVYTDDLPIPRMCAVQRWKNVTCAASDIWQGVYNRRTKIQHDYLLFGEVGEIPPLTKVEALEHMGPLLLREVELKRD